MDQSRVCVIAGANSEIGIAIANQLKKEYRLLLCWHNNDNRIKHLVDNIYIKEYQADLRNEAQCINLYDYCIKEFGRLDILINCIGKNDHSNNITEEVWDSILSANLKPVFFLSKHFITYYKMAEDNHSTGSIINLASTAGINPLPSSPHYVASKAGVIALTKYYSKLYSPYVTVNSIAPGFVNTSNHQSSQYESVKCRIPLQRMATVDEIAQTAYFLLQVSYLTAQIIIIDGGMSNVIGL